MKGADNELIERYEQVFGEPCRSRNKQYLVRRIAWRLQANDEGGLTVRAINQAERLAAGADVRVTAPRKEKLASVAVIESEPNGFVDWDPRLPPPGNMLERQYKGRMIRVMVLAEGFEYEAQRYRSLSASFAQFEREIIGERIRDKIAAQCKRGQWTGGYPVPSTYSVHRA